MNRLASTIRRMIKDEEGATMVEYAMMAFFIAVVCFGAVTMIGQRTDGLFVRVVQNWK